MRRALGVARLAAELWRLDLEVMKASPKGGVVFNEMPSEPGEHHIDKALALLQKSEDSMPKEWVDADKRETNWNE